MKKYEIAAMNEDELKTQVVELRRRLHDLRFNKVIEPPQNPMIFRNIKKDIARIKTALANVQKQDRSETND